MPLSLKAIIGGGSSPVGSYLTGKLAADTNYLRCNAARYLLSAYPDVQTLVDSGQLVTNYEMSEQYTNRITVPLYTQYSTYAWVADNNRILFGSRAGYSTDTHLINRSDDSGTSWSKLVLMSNLAVACGLSQSASMTVHDIIKVGTDSYCAIVSDYGANPKFFTIKTTNAFTSYSVVGTTIALGTGTSFQSYSQRARFVAGPDSNKFIVVVPENGGTCVFLITFDGGTSYQTLQKNGVTWTGGAAFNIDGDGTNLFYASGTTLFHMVWPTNNTPPAFTSVASKFSTSMDRIKKLTNRYVAWPSGSSATINTCTTLTGTYSASTWTGYQSVSDIAEVGTKWFIYCYSTTPAKYTIAHTTDAVSPATPVDRSFVSPAACSDYPLTEWFHFQRRYGTALNSIQFVHGVNDIASTANGTTFTSVYRHIPRTNLGVVKKYGYYFTAAEVLGGLNSSTLQSFSMTSNNQRMLYRSTNLQDWEPLFFVKSDIMDVGSRLFVLVPTGTNTVAGRQTTDGVTWNTTGITEPSKTTLQHYNRLNVCNGLLYWYMYDAAAPSVVYVVSTNSGLSWSNVSPLHVDWGGSATGMWDTSSFQFVGNMAFFNGKYFHISSGWDSVSSFWRYRLGVSTDGISWTFPLATSANWTTLNGQTTSTRQKGPVAVVLNGSLYICLGTASSGGYTNIIKSDDGITFSVYLTGVPDNIAPLVYDANNYPTENGSDVYFVNRNQSPYLVYKNGTPMARSTVGQTQVPGFQAFDETNDVFTIGSFGITRHPKTNVTFTTPNITTPSETFMRVKR